MIFHPSWWKRTLYLMNGWLNADRGFCFSRLLWSWLSFHCYMQLGSRGGAGVNEMTQLRHERGKYSKMEGWKGRMRSRLRRQKTGGRICSWRLSRTLCSSFLTYVRPPMCASLLFIFSFSFLKTAFEKSFIVTPACFQVFLGMTHSALHLGDSPPVMSLGGNLLALFLKCEGK